MSNSWNLIPSISAASLENTLGLTKGEVQCLLCSKTLRLTTMLGSKHFLTRFLGCRIHLGVSWGDLGCILEALEAIWGSFWDLLGTSWKRLGGILGNSWTPVLSISAVSLVRNTSLPASWDLVFISAPLGAILGAFWNLERRSRAHFGRSWGRLGSVLEASWAILCTRF